MIRKPPRQKTNLDSLSRELTDGGWTPGLTPESYRNIIELSGLRGKNLALASVATEIAHKERPITLRGLFYRVVSAGWLPSTDKEHYARLGRIMTRLREVGIVPFHWLVDNLRATQKPSSWTGLPDFAQTVRECYRLDFWASLPVCIHVICEKDAIAGILSPVTREFDIALSPIRGYCSLSYVHEIASLWTKIDKPILSYYLGDFDPSGFDLERDVRAKLSRYAEGADFHWFRLGVNRADFAAFNLLPLPVKKQDQRSAAFERQHGSECAELDAIPPTELRRRLRAEIVARIPADEWARLQQVEAAEKESWAKVVDQLPRRTDGP